MKYILMKPPVARKLAVRHTKIVCLTASFLATGGFKFYYFNMHADHACLFKYITVTAFSIYLSVVKMALKGEVGGHALKSHRNYIVDRGKSWENHGITFLNFCGNPNLASSCYILRV